MWFFFYFIFFQVLFAKEQFYFKSSSLPFFTFYFYTPLVKGNQFF